jgi:hypothetical protein
MARLHLSEVPGTGKCRLAEQRSAGAGGMGTGLVRVGEAVLEMDGRDGHTTIRNA